jgi:hypothetical protein
MPMPNAVITTTDAGRGSPYFPERRMNAGFSRDSGSTPQNEFTVAFRPQLPETLIMRTSILVSGFALSVSLIAGGSALAQTASRDTAQDLPTSSIQEKLTTLGYRNIDRIKRDHGAFEVKASDSKGERVKLYVDPQTGDIINKRAKNHRRDARDQRGDDDGRRNSADCTKRRCRDDLPQQNAAAPLTGK